MTHPTQSHRRNPQMIACNHPGSRMIGKPRDWDPSLDGDCGTIFVADHIDPLSGMNIMYSMYKPTAEDLEALNAGGAIRLGILGTQHPVFQLGVLSPELAAAIDPRPMWDMGPVIQLPTS